MDSIQRVTGRVMLFTLAGLVAGLLTWFISDISGLVRIGDNVGSLSSEESRAYWIVFACWGGLVGAVLSVADALISENKPDWLKVIGIGILVGVFSGLFGGVLGMGAFAALYVFPANNPFDFLRNVIGRAAGWAFIGGLAGTAPGWRKWSIPVGRNGLIGGFIGGLIGGSTFEIIPYLLVGMAHPGIVSRLFGFAITGAMIGLFVALVQQLLKEAWIRIVVGRNEGKEVLIEKQETTIGRYELSDIALFGDPKVARTHAILFTQPGGRFVLRDTGESPLGLIVNGQKVSGETVVKNGDQIQIASKLLVFYERFTRTRTAPAPRDVAEPSSSAPVIGPSLADLPAPGAVSAPMMPAAGASMSEVSGASGMRPVVNAGLVIPGAMPAGDTLFLVALTGPHAGMRFPIRPGSVAGRDPGVDISLPEDSRASRNHARFMQQTEGWVIEDNGSTNGTFVNGQRIQRQNLVSGDTVVVGSTQFRIEQ